MDHFIGLRRDAVRAHPEILDGLVVETAPAPTAAPTPTVWVTAQPPAPLAGFTVLPIPQSPALPLVVRVDGTDEPVMHDEYATLPPRFIEALRELVTSRAACARCGQPVGYQQVEADGELTEEWTFTVLVDGPPRAQDGGLVTDPVSWQCEDCAPDTAAGPWPLDQPPSRWLVDTDRCTASPDGSREIHVTLDDALTCVCGATSPGRRRWRE